MSNQDIIDHSARAHSSVGGSSAKRLMNCPGSVALCEEWPNVESEFAARGTALHEAIDLIFQGKTEKDTDIIGIEFNGFEITEDMYLESVMPALEMWDDIDKELGGIDYFNEQRVVFPDIEGAFGTVDIIGSANDRTIVWDWKFGSGVAVDAEKNIQLMYYAYAAAHTAPTDKFFDKDKPIELFIAQPTVNEGEPFTRWATTYMQLEAFALELRKAVEVSKQPDAPLKMGAWCKFCNGKPGCPLYQNKMREVSGMGREELEEKLTEYAPYFDMMINWGKAGKELMHAEMEKGLKIPGFKLVNKRAIRKWTDEDKAAKMLTNRKIPAVERYEKKLLTPAKAEKVLKKHGASAKFPEGLVEAKSSGTTLATEDDKRPAVVLPSEALKQLSSRLKAV